MADQDEYIDVRCIEITQPIGKFYIGCINADELSEIAYSDVRRGYQENDLEEYLGIQRNLSSARVTEISNYTNTIDAAFPTSIILSLSSTDVEYDDSNFTMRIRKRPKVAKIIDGQHRVAGLKNFHGGGKNFQANVTIFIDMDIEDQAMVFATINLKQEKVSKSLGYDLYEYSRSRSPQKTCHNIAKLLNGERNSPFYNKIKILGQASRRGSDQTITQATFVENLIMYITRDPLKDRDVLKRGKSLRLISYEESEELLFRNMFIQGMDADIAKSISNYFLAVQERWPDAWRGARPGNILNKSTGFTALMRLLKDVYSSLKKIERVLSVEDVLSILNIIQLTDNDFDSNRYVPGGKGQTALYRDLYDQSQVGRQLPG